MAMVSPATALPPLDVSPPEPNPPFVFPARPPTSPIPTPDAARPAPSLSIPAGFESRAGMSGRTGSRRQAVGALPTFDFRPGGPHESSLEIKSQPASPTWSVAVASRPSGHRRGGSEFIGGDGKKGGPGLMSTSPTKGDGALPPPSSLLPSAKGPVRRGHAHRRSGAISCHDLSFLNKPADAASTIRAGSAPTTPAEADGSRTTFLDLMGDSNGRATAEPAPAPWKADAGAPRARVGFSDTLEFIPRPLSTLSSESSSTLATFRGGHSVSGSISSIASASTSSPPSAKGRARLSGAANEPLQRPNTAGAVMSGDDAAPHMAAPVLKRSKSASGSPDLSSLSSSTLPDPSKRRCFRESDGQAASSLAAAGTSLVAVDAPSDPYIDPSPPAAAAPSERTLSREPSFTIGSSSSPDRKPDRHGCKRPRKMKSWAGSILTRKIKHRNQKQKSNVRRAPTPPLHSHASTSTPGPTFDFDDDLTCTIVSRTPAYARPPLTSTVSDPTPRVSSPSPAAAASPMIDLDAALGPFNTPELSPELGSPTRGGFGAAKRRMHSSGVTGGFSGPGMHYHRRAESAPEMAAFEFGQFGLHRLASCSTMADVFEEDEEDEHERAGRPGSSDSAASHDDREDEVLGTGIQVVDSDEAVAGLGMVWTVDAERGTSDDRVRRGSAFSRASSDLQTQATPSLDGSSTTPVEIADDDEPPRASSFTKSSDSTITPPLTGPLYRGEEPPVALDLRRSAPMHPYLTPDTPSLTNSSFPSPDLPPSSFEGPRLLTAASSFTDDHLPMSLMRGEPGPEVRVSVDDVPSLTSSSSTMTSAFHASPYAGADRARGERASSMSSTFSGRPVSRGLRGGKRASLASLSRLVSSSHGEKSKLSIEEKAQPDAPERAVKEKKGKRLSRLMHFWKPKESA
ncbi:MAG: hypothetical protein M1832_003933 [Thelocarpon impressellum]|nr:MAG: hypothetical protein M1832_003933 [Thelocarpon impressellum]